MKVTRPLRAGFLVLASALFFTAVSAQTAQLPPLEVPARSLPVPMTVSPQMQKLISAPLNPTWNVIPQTAAEWKAVADSSAASGAKALPMLLRRMRVTMRAQAIDGVKVYVVTPETIPARNRKRLLIQLHGGCYVFGGGEGAASEAIMMAGFGGYKVLSVDYRLASDGFFPAALDDAVTVWKAALKMTDAKHMGVLGTSAGGALTLELVLRARQLGLPLPGAIAPGTPMADLTKTGDSFHTNALVDNVLVSPEGRCDAAAAFYANGHDLSDPLLSPIKGDLHDFPPAILTTGTRDLLLSNTVRVHRKLREAGVEAQLQVFEGESHAQYLRDDTAPETEEAFKEIAGFFDRHLAK